MRRKAVFGRGRSWQAEDDRYRSLHLGERGARVGEYAPAEPGEYSDSYYGPGDDSYARRRFPATGYERGDYGSSPHSTLPVGGVSGHPPPTGELFQSAYGERQSFGELHPGERSWADLGVSSVRPGEREITRARQPSFKGRGPKNYRRSDERIREIVCERLTDDLFVDASDVHVEVKNGELTLSGTVDSRAAKWRAEDIAGHSAGAPQIHNQLRVRRD